MKRYYKTKKYYDQKTNTTYDSKSEFLFNEYLKTNYPYLKVQKQVPFELLKTFKDVEGRTIRGIKYIADFVITDEYGDTCIIDIKPNSKSCIEQVFKIKWKLMKSTYKEYHYKVIAYDSKTKKFVELRV